MSSAAIDLVSEPDPDHTEWLLRLRARVATDIADDKHSDIIFAQLSHALDERISGCSSALVTVDDTNVTTVRASTMPAQATDRMHRIRRRDWFGTWAAAMTRQTEVSVPDISASTLYREHHGAYLADGLLAARSFPLVDRHNAVGGALVIYLDHARILEPHELDVFEIVTDLANLALRHEQTRQQLLDRIRLDPLTGLENREGLEDHVRAALTTSTAQGL